MHPIPTTYVDFDGSTMIHVLWIYVLRGARQMTTSQLPDATYVERVLAAFERYPQGAQYVSFLALLGVVAFVAWCIRSKK